MSRLCFVSYNFLSSRKKLLIKYEEFLLFSAIFFNAFPHSGGANTFFAKRREKQFVINLLLGASYEAGVSQSNTVRISGPFDMGFLYETYLVYDDYIGGFNIKEKSYFYVRPAITGEFRHYYDLEKRLGKGKRVDKNSGNFLAPVVSLYGPAFIKSNEIEATNFSAAVGAVWGIQRNYGKSFNFQLSLGPGIGFTNGEMAFVPVGELSLGFRIGR